MYRPINVRLSQSRIDEILVRKGRQHEIELQDPNARVGNEKISGLKRASASALKSLKSAFLAPFSSDSRKNNATQTGRVHPPAASGSIINDLPPRDIGARSSGLKGLLKRLRAKRAPQSAADPVEVDARKVPRSLPDIVELSEPAATSIDDRVYMVPHEEVVHQQPVSSRPHGGNLDEQNELEEGTQHIDEHHSHITNADKAMIQLSVQSATSQKRTEKRPGSGYQQIWEVLFNSDPAQFFGTWDGSKVWDYSGSYNAVCRQTLPGDEDVQYNTNIMPVNGVTAHESGTDSISNGDMRLEETVDRLQDGRSAEKTNVMTPELRHRGEQGIADIHSDRENTTCDNSLIERRQQIRTRRVFEIVRDLEVARRESIARFADLNAGETVPETYEATESSEEETSEGDLNSFGSETTESDDGQVAKCIEIDEKAASGRESGEGTGGDIAGQHELVIVNDPDVWIRVFNVVKDSVDLPREILLAQTRVNQELKFRANQR